MFSFYVVAFLLATLTHCVRDVPLYSGLMQLASIYALLQLEMP